MTQTLIEAAAKGNLTEVEKLLTSGANINFIGTSSDPKLKKYHYEGKLPVTCTALTIALANQHWDLAKYLLINGAKVEVHANQKQDGYYMYKDIYYLNAFLMCGRVEIRLDVFELIVKKCNELHFGIIWSEIRKYSSIGNIFDPDTDRGFLSVVKNQVAERKRIIYFEALLRNQVNIDLPLDNNNSPDVKHEYKTWIRKHGINLELFKRYIENREFSFTDKIQVEIALNNLVLDQYISQITANEVKELVANQFSWKLTLVDFPKQLQPFVKNPSTKSLSESIAELMYFIYPEENLPSLPIDSEHLMLMDKNKKYNEIEKERVRSLQNPEKIREFLALNDTNIIMRLYYGSRNLPANAENPAILILAEILLYHANDSIKTSKGLEPLLNKEQIKKSFTLLTKVVSSLNDTEQLSMNTHWDQVDMMIALQQDNHEMHQSITELQQENSKMSSQLANVEKNMQALLSTNQELLKVLQNLKPDIKPAESKSVIPNLFRNN